MKQASPTAAGWCRKWLPILMGCHCREDRSFHYKGKPFPVCARCTGELLGFSLALLTVWFFPVHPGILAAFLPPLIVDGCLQMRTSYESRNPRRLWTGTLFGYGLMGLFIQSLCAVYRWGYGLAIGWMAL